MATAKTQPRKTATSRAKDRVVIASPKPEIDSDDILLPQDRMVDLAQTITGDLQSIRASGGDVRKYLEMEGFMNDLLLITLNPPGENENPIAQVIVNNRAYDIPRGRMVRVPRFVVEALAHAKQANFKTKRTFVGDSSHMKPIESSAWSFPFGVQNDPRGVAGLRWLEFKMNEPN